MVIELALSQTSKYSENQKCHELFSNCGNFQLKYEKKFFKKVDTKFYFFSKYQ